MSLLQSLQLEHLPQGYTVHLAMFHDVKNTTFLHKQLLAGNTEFEYAFVDASIVCASSGFSRDCHSSPACVWLVYSMLIPELPYFLEDGPVEVVEYPEMKKRHRTFQTWEID